MALRASKGHKDFLNFVQLGWARWWHRLQHKRRGPSLGSETHTVGFSKMVAQASACERHRINNLARGSLESKGPGLWRGFIRVRNFGHLGPDPEPAP
jgi:hypothetical protein